VDGINRSALIQVTPLGVSSDDPPAELMRTTRGRAWHAHREDCLDLTLVAAYLLSAVKHN
jgi:hypothetical protein